MNDLFLSNESEQVAYEASLDKRSRQQANIETRIRMRGERLRNSLVSSEVTYNAEAMRQVSRSFGRAIGTHAAARWEGHALLLRSSDSNDDLDVFKTYLPNAKARTIPSSHQNLFTDGLPHILTFLNDDIASNSGKPFPS